MTYAEVEDILGTRGRRRMRGRATYLERFCRHSIVLKYHGNIIMRWYRRGEVQLWSRGYRTISTKRRLNEYAPAGFYIYQRQFVWYYAGGERTFTEGMILPT